MRLKWLSLLFLPVGLVLLMSDNTFASPTVVSLSSFNGWYGYQINNNTPVGNAALTGSLPNLQIITGVNNTEKKLYGIGNRFTFNLPTGGARYDVSVRFQLHQFHQDTYYLDTPQNQKTATWTFDDGSTTTTYCTVEVSGGGSEAYMVNFVCSYSGSKRPTVASATLGRTSSGLSGDPIMYSTRSDSSIYVNLASYWYEVITNDQQGVIDELGNIDDTLNDQFDKENDAVDNIENQTPPSSGSGQNATTSSLLQTLQSFVTALQGISATNCNVTLAFPNFAGGSMVVNPCQNKEFAGNIISIGGSLLLITFYIPVAYMLIRKIYSEIRSFTNG